MKKTSRKQTTTSLVFVALTAAITSILSQIALPSPTGVPMTLQTFAFALIGYILFSKHAFYSILLYLLLGAVGLPVFANLRGGLMHLAGLTGGFLWGSLLLVLLTGFGAKCRRSWQAIFWGLLGLILFHTTGILQYAWLTQNTLRTSFLLVSMPYILKDVLSIIGAYYAGSFVRKQLLKSGIIL